MNDSQIRLLERRASEGDPDAEEQLRIARMRQNGVRHADKIGKWVVIDGVRDHYRGRLLGVTEVGGGFAYLHMAPCYWLASLESTTGEKVTTATEEHPFDLQTIVVGGVSLQPEGWPEQ